MEINDNKIRLLYNKACEYLEDDKYEEVIKCANEGLELIPEPKSAYEQSLLLYIILGDTYYYLDDTLKSLELFYNARNCPSGLQHPFVNLRIGQLYFETGHIMRTKEFFLLSYYIANREIFENEDPVFLEILDDALAEENISDLDPELSERIDKVIFDSSHEWRQGNNDRAIKLLEHAWNLLPDNKLDYIESYIISCGFIENAIVKNDISLLKVWYSNLIDSCSDVDFGGEREFVAGKAAYELDDKETALMYFKKAFDKNKDISFEQGDEKYEDFYRNKCIKFANLS